MQRIWEKLQQKKYKSLDQEDRRCAELMIEHQDIFDLDAAFADQRNYIGNPEHPVFHLMLHATIEEQLTHQDPEEAILFFNSMQRQRLDSHENIHLMGMIFQYAMFSNIGKPDEIVDETYRSLLAEHHQENPDQIVALIEESMQNLVPDPEQLDALFEYETISSDQARQELDEIIDHVAAGGAPVGISSANGNEAVVVPSSLFDILSQVGQALSNPDQEANDLTDISGLFAQAEEEDKETVASYPLPLSKAFNNVLQLKIGLKGAKPPIWRRIQIPADYTFWDLHVAIQNAMGWEDVHIHEFSLKDSKTGALLQIGIPAEYESNLGLPGIEPIYGWTCRVSDYLTADNPRAQYEYDFGDSWVHEILLEETLPRTVGIEYPVCIKGKRACPPEDSGGIPGYQGMLNILADTDHPEYRSLMEWLGEEFDPAAFDKSNIEFLDPREYLQQFVE